MPGWLGVREAEALFEALLVETAWEDPVLRMGARTIPMPRRVAFHGPFAYAYSGHVHPAREMTARLEEVRARVEMASGHRLNTVLVNLYRSGADSVSWHSDDDYEHGGWPAVVSLSLGATRRFHLAEKRGSRRYRVELTSGGLLVMAGRSQIEYRHALPKTRLPVGPRINLTFRHMARASDIL
jgi:alkylated DNA repair dioxygenase AlkB